MRRILYATNAREYKLFIGGGDNFRYQIDPTYKANRDDKPRPEWLQQVREHLVVEWKAHIADGIETDDHLGIEQSADNGQETVICSYDKDLLQVPGKHYNFNKDEWKYITPLEGWANFYTQLIMGDRSDNIQGFDGKMRVSVPKFLQPYVSAIHESCSDPWEMFQVVESIYELGEESLLKNGRLLYILRHENDEWNFPTSPQPETDTK
jgi:5'-3' exonuclease